MHKDAERNKNCSYKLTKWYYQYCYEINVVTEPLKSPIKNQSSAEHSLNTPAIDHQFPSLHSMFLTTGEQ